jgi:BolA family transcriptional regulator, general stress-responsive regulator
MVVEDIDKLIRENLNPTHLKIIDNSGLHADHYNGKYKITHLHVEIVSNIFDNMSRVSRHRKVYSVLEDGLKSWLHSMTIAAYSENEWDKFKNGK